MRISRKFSTDQETIQRFIAVFGGGIIALSNNNKLANPGFFILAHTFIRDYIEKGFFRKEELLIQTLTDIGFPPDDGPIYFLRNEQNKSHEAAVHLIKATEQWQTGDMQARMEVGWAASEYSSTIRQHLERLKNLIFPLIEQNIPIEGEHALSEKVDEIIFEGDLQTNPERFDELIVSLEEELSDWR